MDPKAKVLLFIRNTKLQGRRLEKGEGKEADEEGRMNELTVEVQPGHQSNRMDSKTKVLLLIRNNKLLVGDACGAMCSSCLVF